MRNPYLPCLLVFCLAACETAVEVDVPRNPPQLTVNSLFNPDSVWQVELTENRYILDNEPFAAVPDAEVRVLQEGRTVAVLDYRGNQPYNGNSIYRAADGRPEAGEQYTLEVSRPTAGGVSARSRVPPVPTPILSVVWDTLDVREIPTSIDRVAYGVTIRFDDPPEENFYSLSFIVRNNFVILRDIDDDGEQELVVRRNELNTNATLQSDDPLIDDPFDRYAAELLFKDARFNGQEYELKLYMQQFIGVSGGVSTFLDIATKDFYVLNEEVYDLQGNVVFGADESFPSYELFALLRTTTEEYYNYTRTRDLQASVESNPFAQPVQVFDNIEGGLGVFAGYSQVEKEVTIK
ncbi:MAG: DUF4249 domain-containing protein [Tunicatimonas sp.]